MVRQIEISEAFSKQIKTKRLIELDMDMRTAAKKIGISPATLSRCENGGIPDLLTYASLCYWLGEPLDAFVITSHRKPKSKK